jgi:hypothetical protein
MSIEDDIVSQLLKDVPLSVGTEEAQNISAAALYTILSLLKSYGYRLVPSSIAVTDYTDFVQAIESATDLEDVDPAMVQGIIHHLANRGWTILPPTSTF